MPGRPMVTGIILLVVLGLCGWAQGQERENKIKPAGGNWFSRLWRGKGQAAKDTEQPKEKPGAVGTGNSIKPAPLPSARPGQDYQVFLRRSDAVLKLQEIADQYHDEKLMRMAEQLNQRLGDSLQAKLHGSGNFPADEQILENHLGERTIPYGGNPGIAQRRDSPSGPLAGRKE